MPQIVFLLVICVVADASAYHVNVKACSCFCLFLSVMSIFMTFFLLSITVSQVARSNYVWSHA